MTKIMISSKEVCERYGFSERSLYRMVASGSFPKPKLIGSGIKRWHANDLLEWESGLGYEK